MQGSVDCSAVILLHWFAVNKEVALGFHLSLLASIQCLYFNYFIFSPPAFQVGEFQKQAGCHCRVVRASALTFFSPSAS